MGTDEQTITESLLDRGFSVVPHFLEPELVRDLGRDFDALLRDGKFKTARVGKQEEVETSSRVRNDKIYWFEAQETTHPRPALAAKLQTFRTILNRAFYLGIQDFEMHYAHYEPGGFYKRHRDIFEKDDRRAVSFVIYLNENWKTTDGGRLLLHAPEGESVAVDPTAGTAVFFFSDREHEVTESFAARRSCTGWFRRAPRSPNE